MRDQHSSSVSLAFTPWVGTEVEFVLGTRREEMELRVEDDDEDGRLLLELREEGKLLTRVNWSRMVEMLMLAT